MRSRPAILLACGSFNPPTNAHLRMMELARDVLHSLPTPYRVLEAIYSPVSASYGHKKLIGDHHRLAMLQQATASAPWLRVDDWEQRRGVWSRTVEVLKHHRDEARRRLKDDSIEVFLVCGGDLIESFDRLLPDGSRLWAVSDVRAVVEDYGVVVIERPGSNPKKTLEGYGLSATKCHTVQELACPSELSSTLLRKAVADGRSIRYCTPDSVVEYIHENKLYRE